MDALRGESPHRLTVVMPCRLVQLCLFASAVDIHLKFFIGPNPKESLFRAVLVSAYECLVV